MKLRILFDRYFSEIFWCLFLILGILGVLHHDMWRDELQAWMIVQNSHSLIELYTNLRYESHPPLWYWLLMLTQRFSLNPISMQWATLSIASMSAWLVLKFSPFNKLQKVLLIFGYFLFYEYTLMSRSYALDVLFVFIFCIVFKRPERNYLLLSLILILLSLTSMMGLIFAVSLGAFLIFEFLENYSISCKNLPRAILALIFLVAAFCFSFNSMIPPQDGGYIKDLIRTHIFQNFCFLINGVYLPDKFSLLPGLLHRFFLIFSFSVLCVSLLFFIKKRSVLFLYVLGGALFVPFFLIVSSYPRHFGHLFILLISCWWIYPDISRLAKTIILFLLSFQFVFGVASYSMCLSHKESSDGAQAAKYIQTHGLNELPMLGDAYGSSCVAGYLNSPIFYLREHRWGTFVLYNNKKEPSPYEILETARNFSQRFKKDILLILTYSIDKFSFSQIQTVRIFNKGIDTSSRIYLYLYKYNPGLIQVH